MSPSEETRRPANAGWGENRHHENSHLLRAGLLSQIYEISRSSVNAKQGLNSIKHLIECHGRKKSVEPVASATSQMTTHHISPLTPPRSTSDDTSAETYSTEASIRDRDDSTEESESRSPCDEDGDTNRGFLASLAEKQAQSSLREDTENLWNEFSLEEELEGIADAPAQDRAVMRAAMHEREKARKKWLQESAAEKRRIAEREGLKLQKAFRNAAFSAPPDSPAQHKDCSSAAQVFTTATAAAPQAFPTSSKSSSEVHVVARKSMVEDDDDDEDGEKRTGQQISRWQSSDKPKEATSPVIISITGSPTRNVDRFGIEFAPENLANNFNKENHRRSILIQNIPHSFTREHFGHPASGKGVSVSLLPMPTYPTPESLAYEGGEAVSPPGLPRQTRCLLIDSFPKKFVNELCIELLLDVRHTPTKIQTLEEMWFEDDTLHINFTSIREAVKAYNTVKYFYFGKFSMNARFGVDPCSLPILEKVDAVGNIKLASHGCVRLKSLIETVGLAAYSRSHRDEHDHSVSNALSHKAEEEGKHSSKVSALLAGDTAAANKPSTMGIATTMPWTEELMKGLELF
ncbi:hypothetical protein CMQ_330 [Grosmannia clavigera kw1407]|uniref:Uncharacterized protein n=1 Tax=Grosmannia clavigera (strain kw1407 / UAMH 11150) TaxID=655863 RepID=F0XQW9_GROCL|nr:uncharacterized protein CMQ_330 [Grosmannia clavigera kw1407]EFX00013.1 hypothetical protein CMQ_330 [Grosmannia clavigera kw1407]